LGFFDSGSDFSFSSLYSYGRSSGSRQIVSLDLDPQEILNNSLRIAAREGRLLNVKELIKKGAEIDSRSDSGQTALMGATKNCSIAVVNYLIEQGANINARDFSGRTALIHASNSSCFPVVQVITKAPSVEYDVKDRFQKTAWDYASENSIFEVDGPSEQIMNVIQLARKRPTAKLIRGNLKQKRGTQTS
jgi:ankyrin repeat protein